MSGKTYIAKKKEPDYPVFEMKKKGKLIVPNHIITQINYLHGKIGDTEWSGMLFYDVVKGSPQKPEEFVLIAKDIFLMDIGTAGYTEYETDGDIVDFYDERGDEAMEWKIGHIHTHHSMNTYFSATDMSELNDNVDKHNYYLSLIVNFKATFSAKVAFLSEVQTTSKMSIVDDSGKKVNFKHDYLEKSMVVVDMNVYYDMDDSFFYDRYKQVVEKKEKAAEAAERARKEKYKSWSNNDSQLSMERFNALPAAKGSVVDADPKNMTNIEVEKLARNVFSVTPDLSETRGIYQILLKLSQARKDQIEYYYQYLADNVELVIENFFDQGLEVDEMEEVLSEVIASLLRFENNPSLKDICEGISEVLTEFNIDYKKRKDDEDMKEQLEDEALETEMELIT